MQGHHARRFRQRSGQPARGRPVAGDQHLAQQQAHRILKFLRSLDQFRSHPQAALICGSLEHIFLARLVKRKEHRPALLALIQRLEGIFQIHAFFHQHAVQEFAQRGRYRRFQIRPGPPARCSTLGSRLSGVPGCASCRI